jgi:ArsR family transcriptional regulator
MAEALLKHAAGDQFEVASAGSRPEQPHPLAIKALADAGFDTQDLHSKGLGTLADQPWDYVISLCDKAARECQSVAEQAQHIAWDFPDPALADRLATFTLTLKELRERISLFVMVHQKSTSRIGQYSPASVFKALGDDSRLAIMLLIRDKEELCVCELTGALEISQPRISKSLAQLRELNLLLDERRGQWNYYRLHPVLPKWIHDLLATTADASASALTPLTERLTVMPNRPPKKDCA